MQKNEITIYYGGFLRKSGGAFMHARSIAQELQRKGCSVQIITLDNLPLLFRYVPHITQIIINIFNPPMGFFYKGRFIRGLYKFFFDTGTHLRIFEDIYISWGSKIPSVSILHAVWSDNLQSLSVSDKQKDKLINYEAKIINSIEHPIITVSEPYLNFLTKNHFSKHSLQPIKVIPLGLDLSEFRSRGDIPRRSKSIIYCGALEARKNVLFLLKVFKNIYSADCGFRLTIIGDGPDRRELQEFSESNQIPVHFLGRLEHEKVLVEFPRHEFYMHPSVKESFSFALLEAKLSGLKTCAYEGLEVPDEFIDLPMSSFEVDEWSNAFLSNKIDDKLFDASKFSLERMANDTLSVAHSFFPGFVKSPPKV